MSAQLPALSDPDIAWVDISTPLSVELAVYEGDPGLTVVPLCGLDPANADSWAASVLAMCTHTGTHIDPPSHFIAGGAAVDAVSLEVTCGRARVLDVRGMGPLLGPSVFEDAGLEGVERLLLKTDNAQHRGRPFQRDYVAISAEAALFIVKHSSVRLIGIDYLSIEAFDSPGYPVHRTLLGASPPVVILEGLDLSAVEPGAWDLWCMPLRLVAGDGGPARALLWRRR